MSRGRGAHPTAATDASDDEFPLLKGNGLYASAISGDGDCLFHALSDQIYGHENSHHEIRARVVSHMRQHADYFRFFLDVGHTSGRPKRGKSASSASTQVPSEAAIDRAFEAHLKRMSQSGVYGDNMEICAFAREYDYDVKIYQRDFAYVVTGGMDENRGGRNGLVHIAYHTWEHYSSIRNIAGPHTGLPNVNPTPMSAEAKAEAEKRSKSDKGYALPWMVQNVMRSLPYHASEEEVEKYLIECKGDVNEAVGRMLDKHLELGDEDAETKGDEKHTNLKGGGKAEKSEEIPSSDNVPPPPPPPPPGKKTKKPSAAAAAAAARKQAKEELKKNNPISKDQNKIENSTGPAATPDPKNKPKKETARERKERQKAAAKARKQNSGGNASATSDAKSTSLESDIRELYI